MESNTEKLEEENDGPVFCKSIRYYFREYCNCSSIHGFRYFGEKRTYFERIWWFIVFGIVVAVCAYQIREVYQKWERSPVIVSFATSETPIYNIPFPAVTICPESKSLLSRYNHSNILDKLSSVDAKLNNTEIKHALYMSLICDVNLLAKLRKYGNQTFSDDFLNFLNKTRRETFFHSCSWMGDPIACSKLFVPIITDEGICYTFNMLDREDIYRENIEHYSNFLQSPEKRNLTWNLDDGYPKHEKIVTYPRRALFAGVKNALGVSLVVQKDEIDLTCKESAGFRVIMHTPMRLPRPSNQYFRVPLNQVVLGSIQPIMILTSETVKVYNPRRRECYFPSERRLKYLKIYTHQNCQLECLTNFTLSLCKCVQFFMPRENGTSICGSAKKSCVDLAERLLQTKGLITKLDELQSKNETVDEKDDIGILGFKVPRCDCMPTCTDLSYDVETSQAEWDWQEKYRTIFKTIPYGNNTHMSRLTLYFKNSQFVTSKRHELYGPTDFLANFGGLLGLFTGFSVLSVMEIVYFLTIRLCCNIRLHGAWYGPDIN